MKLYKYILTGMIGFISVLATINVVGAENSNVKNSVIGKGKVENAKFSINAKLYSNNKEKIKIQATTINPNSEVRKIKFIDGNIDWETGFIDGTAKVWYSDQKGYETNRVMVHTIDADEIDFPGLKDTFWVLVWDNDKHYFDPFGNDTVISGDIDHR